MKIKQRRPEEKAAGVLAHESGPDAPKKVAKTFTAMKAEEGGEFGSGIKHPTDEQLEKINRFTKSPKTTEEVVVFSTLSCNDILDRDLDKFRTKCIQKFAALPEPYSPVGKPYMVAHDTTKLPVGRLFDVGTKRVEDNLHLTNDVYMPNTEQYKGFLENVDFGIYWAVSVGVMLDAGICMVGKEHSYMGKWWCSQGHEKGLYYDPDSEEKDAWGWPLPVEEGSKGAVLCTRDFDNPSDFYELSQVYLGAQYFAELQRDPQMEGAIKAAKSFGGFVNLGAKEAERLPLQHVNQDVVRAKLSYPVIEKEDGSARWVDDKGFVYIYDASTFEVLCMGKESIDNGTARESELLAKQAALTGRVNELLSKLDGDSDKEGATAVREASEALTEVATSLSASSYDEAEQQLTAVGKTVTELEGKLSRAQPEPENKAGHTHYHKHGEDTVHSHNHTHSAGNYDHTGDDAEVAHTHAHDNKEAPEAMSKKAVQAAAREAELPAAILDKLVEAGDDDALSVLVTTTAEHIGELQRSLTAQEPLVKAGNDFVDGLKDRVKESYIRAKQLGDQGRGVDTSLIEQLITLAGSDTKVLQGLYEQYQKEAEEKFPTSVRRSSFPEDPHTQHPVHAEDTPEEVHTNGKKSIVGRIHG